MCGYQDEEGYEPQIDIEHIEKLIYNPKYAEYDEC
jgi:hypothetical protein